jgi:hypothetical protein
MPRTPRVLLVGFIPSFLLAQDAKEQRFVERVEVRVRTAIVFVTDKDNKAVPAKLSPGDLVATESGEQVEILSVEPLLGTARRTDQSSNSSSWSPPTAGSVTQYLYLDTLALNQRTTPQLARLIEQNLERLLEVGPLEIVIANPSPRVLQAATQDVTILKAKLQRLPRDAPGQERLLMARRDALQELRDAINGRSPMATQESARSTIRMNVTLELSLLKQSLNHLEQWAARRPDDQAGILYLCNDGFDTDPLEIYREAIPRNMGTLRQEVFMLSSEFAAEVPKMISKTERTLAGKGLTTIPVAIGGMLAEYVGNASNIDTRGNAALLRLADGSPLFFYARPYESLLHAADATGGEVVSSASAFGKLADRFASAYVVTLRSRSVADGRPHEFMIASRRPDLTVRSSRYVVTGSPAAASESRAIRVLEGSEGPTDMPLVASVSDVGSSQGRFSGQLRLAVNFAALAPALGDGAPVHLRVSLAVDLNDSNPFTSSEEVDWVASSTSWRYQIPMTWPKGARRLAVVVEELSTGASASTIVDLTSPS